MSKTILAFIVVALMASCKPYKVCVNKPKKFNDAIFIPIDTSYKLFMRKICFDFHSGSNKLKNCSHQQNKTDSTATVEIEYILYSAFKGKAIWISFLPSFYYLHNPQIKQGRYDEPYMHDSIVNISFIRRFIFMDVNVATNTLSLYDNEKLDYTFTYKIHNDELEILKAKDEQNTYLVGISHVDETIKAGLKFEAIKEFSFDFTKYKTQRHLSNLINLKEFQREEYVLTLDEPFGFYYSPKNRKLYINAHNKSFEPKPRYIFFGPRKRNKAKGNPGI